MKTVPKQPCLTRSHPHEDPRLIELVGSCPPPGPAHVPGGNTICLHPRALFHLSGYINYSSLSSFPSSLFHFYNISSLGQVMKRHRVYYRQQNMMILSQVSFIRSTDNYWALTMHLASARYWGYTIKQDTVTKLEFITILRETKE